MWKLEGVRERGEGDRSKEAVTGWKKRIQPTATKTNMKSPDVRLNSAIFSKPQKEHGRKIFTSFFHLFCKSISTLHYFYKLFCLIWFCFGTKDFKSFNLHLTCCAV